MPTAGKLRVLKYAPPPSRLPIYQRVDPREVSFFGRTNYEAPLEEKKFIFGVKRKDRRRHMYIVGKSGAGKSKLIELLIRQDIAYGYGLALFDPTGGIVRDIVDFVPEERINDVVLIDPTDSQYPVSLNPFSGVESNEKPLVTESFLEIFKKQFGAHWTPPIEYIARLTVAALLDYPSATMRGMIMMLNNERYRQDVVGHIQDDQVRKFWSEEFVKWNERYALEAVVPFINRLEQMMSHPLLRTIFGQKASKIKFDSLIQERKIILVNLAKDKLGEENAAFLGSLIMLKIREAGIARTQTKEDFYLYFDDFPAVATGTFGSFFIQARQYGFPIVLAHQTVSQLDHKLLATILGNTGAVIVFRLGGEDAVALDKEIAPALAGKDTLNLGRQEFYIKMTIDGDTDDAFSAETLAVLPPTHESFREAIVELSRKRYAVHAETIKKDIEAEGARFRS